jgi:hypothetical protein
MLVLDDERPGDLGPKASGRLSLPERRRRANAYWAPADGLLTAAQAKINV